MNSRQEVHKTLFKATKAASAPGTSLGGPRALPSTDRPNPEAARRTALNHSRSPAKEVKFLSAGTEPPSGVGKGAGTARHGTTGPGAKAKKGVQFADGSEGNDAKKKVGNQRVS